MDPTTNGSIMQRHRMRDLTRNWQRSWNDSRKTSRYYGLNDKLRHDEDIQVNDKRILRICRKKQIRSNLKSRYNGCTRASNNPAFIAENILNREFKAEHLNEKWVTDVTEFKYGNTLDSVLIFKRYIGTYVNFMGIVIIMRWYLKL